MKLETSERLLVEELFLKSKSKDSKLVQVENVEKLTGDASTRRYYRVYSEGVSYVACLDTPNSENTENNFLTLQRVLNDEGVRVPKIIDRDLTKGYILQEDLGDATFLKELPPMSELEEFDFYKSAIDLVAKIHLIDTNKYGAEKFTQLSFDFEKLFSEMEFSKKFFLHRFLGVNPESMEVKKLYLELGKICRDLEQLPRVLVHRDYHSRNLMIKNKEQVVIDFQDARMGTPLYDIASLLDDCYYQLVPENKLKLQKYYYDLYYSKVTTETFEQFVRHYDLMTIQRVYKAIGSFAYIYADRSDLRYVKYIGFAFEKLRSVLMKYPEFNNARTILSGLYYAN